MISSALMSDWLTSDPSHPKPREDQRAAADRRHPEKEMRAEPDESDQCQCCDCDTCNDVARTVPYAAQHVDQRDEQRDEGRDLLVCDGSHDEEGRGDVDEYGERG